MPDQFSDNFTRTFSKEDITITQKLIDWIVKSGKKIIIVTEAVVLLSLFVKFNLIRNVNAVNYKIEDLRLAVIDSTEREAEFNKIISDINKIKEIEKGKVDWDFMFTKINGYVPEDMSLVKTSFASKNATLSAEVQSVEGFATFISKLVSDKEVNQVILSNSDFDREENIYTLDMSIVFN